MNLSQNPNQSPKMSSAKSKITYDQLNKMCADDPNVRDSAAHKNLDHDVWMRNYKGNKDNSLYAYLGCSERLLYVGLMASSKYEAPVKENACWHGKVTEEILLEFIERYKVYCTLVDTVDTAVTRLETVAPTVDDTNSKRLY